MPRSRRITPSLRPSVPPSLRPSVPPSLPPSVPPSIPPQRSQENQMMTPKLSLRRNNVIKSYGPVVQVRPYLAP